ncbi:hypothetical protein A2803_01705 [Candidatus Woesebacteria bacterium RIFCSPHIGHO2_01_FULL_44_21]|uniref:Type II secretion system protein GspF domain-containing protein n=1 Tax=Candidatus Woesebacteria bacterium RIFCSPHIGHO2_01_FULL_44_21 TaxID=1802503 RepID=A0A1F7YV18_9BACT|nr:MAG: hypothetical protein A2803_01705 [Candidatus Woesebacteria bacterium RIFCSPHIGHO2_01_FULL_44_21]OGM69588.1 MAG: hypothetical protein A2897_03220 [Candidatus Woesebacteria bacterium RIFCSPLOWO2_01_FULL_44_24b]
MKLNSQVQIFKHISFLDKALFTKHLAVMTKSGIPLAESVDSLEEQAKNPTFKKILAKVSADIQNGQSLYKSMARHPRVFDTTYLSLVQIGEESGQLEKNLEYLAANLKKSYEFRKKVVSASLYPMIVLVMAVVVGFGISYFVLPKLIDLFESLDVELPLTTKILLFIANTMKDYGIFIMAGVLLSIILFRIFVNLPKVKIHWHRFLLGLPTIGSFMQSVQMTSMCRNIGVMLQSGLDISTTLETQKTATDNLVYKEYLASLQRGIEKGKSLKEQLESSKFHFVPSIATKMIAVGEKTGTLESAFSYLGDFFEDEVDNASKNLSSTLEPILLIGISLIVGFVALAVITPIYDFTSSIHK